MKKENLTIADHVKSVSTVLVIALVWGSFIVIQWPLMIFAYYVDRHFANPKDTWLYSILIGQDCLVNAILSGHFKTTISSTLGEMKVYSDTAYIVSGFVDYLFLKLFGQRDHCTQAMESEDKYTFTARRALVGFSLYSSVFSFSIYSAALQLWGLL